MAQERPTRAPRGLQEGPQEGPKRDIGPNLAQRPLQESPGTLPDPSGDFPGPSRTPPGSDFETNSDSQNGPPEGKITSRIFNSTFFLLPAVLLRWHGGGVCRRHVDTIY